MTGPSTGSLGSTGAASNASRVPSAVADYRIQRLIGSGSNGTVLLARPPTRLGTVAEYVAVKILGPTADAIFDRVVHELRVAAGARSPYLASMSEVGLDGTTLFVVSDYQPRGSLSAPGRPLSTQEVLLAVANTASAAHALHEVGVVHGAIRPQNVLIGPHNALLADLSLTRILQPGLTVTGLGSVSSVEYLDPAVLRGSGSSRASDIWALGATVHRALSGVGLYGELPDNQPVAAIRRVTGGAPTIATNLPPAAAELISACLAPVPARPPTAAVVADQLYAAAAAVH